MKLQEADAIVNKVSNVVPFIKYMCEGIFNMCSHVINKSTVIHSPTDFVRVRINENTKSSSCCTVCKCVCPQVRISRDRHNIHLSHPPITIVLTAMWFWRRRLSWHMHPHLPYKRFYDGIMSNIFAYKFTTCTSTSLLSVCRGYLQHQESRCLSQHYRRWWMRLSRTYR